MNDQIEFIRRFPEQILCRVQKDMHAYKDSIGVLQRIFPNNAAKLSVEPTVTQTSDRFGVDLNVYQFETKDLVHDLKAKGFDVAWQSHISYFTLPTSQLEEFIKSYWDYANLRVYSFPRIASEVSINWSDDLIVKFADVWNFSLLQKNPKVKWNFDLIDRVANFICWYSIPSCAELQWTADLLWKYRDRLVFSTSVGYYDSRARTNDFYAIEHYYRFQERKTEACKNMSQSKTILWSQEIIERLKDYWDWSDLSENDSIKWTEELIDSYLEFIDFQSLSRNPSVSWSEQLISKYYDKWHWGGLSGNPGLPWSFAFIATFERNWIWQPERRWYIHEECLRNRCLSNNPGIFWELEMCNRWSVNLDFWCIARRGKISFQVLTCYQNELDRNELIGWKFHRYSDWRETEEIYKTGWENLAENENFCITSENINFLIDKRINLTYAVGNLASNGEYETSEFRVLEILKNSTVKNVLIDELILHYDNWGSIIINENFLNDSVWETIIKPIFDAYVREYGTQLNTKT